MRRDPCDNEQTADMIRAAVAEAGYPGALVWAEDTGVFTEGCPDDVAERAMAMVNEFDARAALPTARRATK